jgi:multicomponent Na+:H+ antiporter subunit B
MVFLVVTALVAIRKTDLFAVVMLFGIYSFLTAVLFMDLDAVDVAFTEAAVGAGISTVLMLSTLRLTGRFEKRHKRNPILPLIVVMIMGGALIYGMLDMPQFGDPMAPIHQHMAPRFIYTSPTEIGVPNMVTSVLASYRGYDTLGETTVIFTAGLAVLLLLGMREGQNEKSGRMAIGDALVLRVVVKVLIAFILLYALYVQFHGDYGAGGGFQAGVIFATGFVIYDLIFGEKDVRRVLPQAWLARLAVLGVLIYAGTGVACMILGHNFLDYSALAHDPVHGQHLGILLIELGVGIAVFAVLLVIFYAFSGLRRPKLLS